MDKIERLDIPPFSQREIDVIACIISGQNNKLIAKICGLSQRTVEVHIRNILIKICESTTDENYASHRGSIIRYVEKSQKREVLEQHYKQLTGYASATDDLGTIIEQPILATQKWYQRKEIILSEVVLALLAGLYIFFADPAVKVTPDFDMPDRALLLKRETILNTIETRMQKDRRVVLVGSGGVGKTTLARSYTREYPAEIIWEINAESEVSAKSSFEQLASVLAVSPQDKEQLGLLKSVKSKNGFEGIFFFVKEKLKGVGSWILIFDNVGDIQDIKRVFPYEMKFWGKGRVLITTRNLNINSKGYFKSADIIEVGKLSQQEQIQMFENCLQNVAVSNDAKLEDRHDLLKHIPPYPLDTLLAAQFFEKTGVSEREFIEILKKHPLNMGSFYSQFSGEIEDATQTRYNIVTTCLKKIISHNPDYQQILFFIALLGAKDIPLELLEEYKGAEIFASLLKELKESSLIVVNLHSGKPTLTIHESTQAILLDYVIKNIDAKNIAPDLETLTAQYMEKIISTENLLYVQDAIIHAKVFQKRIKQVTGKDSLVTLLRIGQAHDLLGNFKEAEIIFKKALSLSEGDDEANLQIIAGLGEVYKHRCNFSEAISAYQEVIRELESNPAKYAKLAEAFCGLANVYKSMGNYKTSKSYFEKSLVLHKKDPQKYAAEIARTQARLGNLNVLLGEYKTGREYLHTALTYYLEHYGVGDIKTSWVTLILGQSYALYGNPEEFLKEQEIGLSVRQQHYGKHHPQTAWAMHVVGHGYACTGKYKEAEKNLKEAVRIYTATFGVDSLMTCKSRQHLSYLYILTGRYKLAREHLTDVEKILEKHYGKTHLQTAAAYVNFGLLYLAEKNPNIAAEYFQKAYDIYDKSKHIDRYKAMEGLYDAHKMGATQVSYEEAINYLQQAVLIVQSELPANSEHRIRLFEKLTYTQKGEKSHG